MLHYCIIDSDIVKSSNNSQTTFMVVPSLSSPEWGTPSRTDVGEDLPSTTSIEDEAPSSMNTEFTVPLFLTQTPTPSSIVLTQPDPTSTTDIETVSFKFPWEISSEQSTPSIFLTTTPAHRSMNDPFVSSEPTHGPVSVSSPSPTSSSHSLSVRAVTGITVGAVLATVFIAAILVMYLHKKNEKRKGAARASRAQAREEVHVDLSPGA